MKITINSHPIIGAGKVFKFGDLATADLIVDAIYEGGNKGTSGDEPINKLVRGGNQGGFRYVGSPAKGNVRLVILYSTMTDMDWPDFLDEETGIFYYFGDNKRPGHELHDTVRKGNLLLKTLFDQIHQDLESRKRIPPIFIFTKAGKGRDVIFRGIAIPGAKSVASTEDLVAVWKNYEGNRFQNYKAIFTILNTPHITRRWIEDVLNGDPLTKNCPKEWRSWALGGIAEPLEAPRTQSYRSKREQLPQNKKEADMLALIKNHFRKDPYKFEKFAAEILKLAEKNITKIEVTRPYRDGGRDAVGEYRLGIGGDSIILDFSVEAKCYKIDNSVGVKEASRLISRLKYRQFGILVTTSYVAEQAYKEIRDDKHPIVIIAGGDIIRILVANGINALESVKYLLENI